MREKYSSSVQLAPDAGASEGYWRPQPAIHLPLEGQIAIASRAKSRNRLPLITRREEQSASPG